MEDARLTSSIFNGRIERHLNSLMAIKTIILKTGENLISDVKEGFLGEKLICYILENPCTMSITGSYKILDDETSGTDKVSIALQKWPLFSKDTKVELSCDSVVTITNPTDDIKTMYENQVVNKNDEIN